jgi:hypothetical protein
MATERTVQRSNPAGIGKEYMDGWAEPGHGD